MTNYRPHWSHYVVAAHLAVFVVTGYALALTRSDLLRVILTIVSGTSLFVLTGLTHEATHHLLARPAWLNDLLGNLAGAVTYTPLSAYRAATSSITRRRTARTTRTTYSTRAG